MDANAETPHVTTLSAKVIRADGTVEDLGVVAFNHPSPLRMWLWEHGYRKAATWRL